MKNKKSFAFENEKGKAKWRGGGEENVIKGGERERLLSNLNKF